MSHNHESSHMRRYFDAIARRRAAVSELGQTAIVAVLAITIITSMLGLVLVNTVSQSFPLQQSRAVQIYANRALEAGENAFLVAVNANPSLAQCNTGTNNAGTCSGIDYGQWNLVPNSTSSGADAEYYAFGNPQPVFNPTTNALQSLTVQVVGAANDDSATNHYLFDQENVTVTPSNGFLENVWWSNYESYSDTGSYTTCNYNWKLNYNISRSGADCSPVYFGPNDYLFGPTYTNDSIFVSGDGNASDSPAFGVAGTTPPGSTVTTADPNCLFVDNSGNDGMNGSDSSCANATSDVALYDSTNSSYGHSVEQPPASDAQLGTIAYQNGCLYSGPTQITFSTNAGGVGQMTVVSPDTPETTVPSLTYQFDSNDLASSGGVPINTNNCPNNGTAPIPQNGVVFVENATTAQTQPFANPFDDPIANTVTNVLSNPAAPAANASVTLTATVTSSSSQLASGGATMSFSQAKCNTPSGTCNSWNNPATINGCSTVTLTPVTPATTPPTATATCHATESGKVGDTFSASYSGGTYTSSSSANVGQTNTYTPSSSYGPDAQVKGQGGCSNCYYGETGTPDAEGDAFVNGSVSGQVTVGTANNVIIDGNITYADCGTPSNPWVTGQSGSSAASQGFCPYSTGGTNDSLGLIADNYVEVNRPILASTSTNNNPTVLPACASPAATCDPSNGTSGLTIDAAVLALTQSFVVNNYGTGGTEGQLIVYGSIQQFARGPVGTFNQNCPPFGGSCTYSLATGYQKHYTWDPLLDFVSPPSYLVPSTPSWVLESVTTNAGVGSASVCPPLLGVYSGLVAGVPTNGPAVTQYCSASPGGLPNYPTSTAPSPPTIGTATESGGTVTVNWTDPVSNGGQTIQRYTVSPNPHCSTCVGTTVLGAGATSATITGMPAGSRYTFTVTATNINGTSSPSSASNSIIIPAAPSAPSGVSATVNASGSVSVGWTASSNGSAITSSTVFPSPACSLCTGTTVSGSASTATITGLTPGTVYTFTVTDTNGIGTSPPSAASNSITAPSKPGAPTIGTATPGNTQAIVNWTAPTNTGGIPVTGYVVTPYKAGVAQATQTFNSTATTETVTGLTNLSSYTFAVAAINGIGTGPASAQSNAVIPAAPPGAPTIGTATAGVNSATVTWTAPGNNGGSAITGYVVTPYIGGTAQTTQTFNSTATTETVTGLTANTSYTFKVAAINAIGTGNQSAASNSITTPKTAPGAPTIGTAISGNASVSLNWTAPTVTGGSAITGYVVTPYIGGVAQATQTFNSTATTQTVTGLTNGTAYTFTVAAINAIGTSAASAQSGAVTPATVPGAPTIGTATFGNASATVTWTAPANNGGAAITGYVVTPYKGGFAQATQTFNSTATTEIVTGLTNGSSYTFKVAAINSVGTGAQSAASNAVTPATVPGAPTITATVPANTSVAITWTAPASNGGSAITAYVVTPYIAGVAQATQTFNSTATTETVTGLTNGTAYTFKVAAINAIGTGSQSAASGSATPATTPGAPTIGTATAGVGSATVTWTAPANNGGAAITGYVVTPYKAGVAQAIVNFGSAATTETVTGLANNTAYTFAVAAVNGMGTGPNSAQSNSVTTPTTPGAPTIGTATAGVGSATVTWMAPVSNGGAPITGYVVTPYKAGVAQTTQTFNSTATTETAIGLANNTAYTFAVAAINGVGTGPNSAQSNSVTTPTTPGAPTIGTATSGQASATVTWTAPASNGGNAITGYVITPYLNGTTAQATQTFNSTATTETATGLTNGSAYTFKVAAINGVGAGTQSAASNSVTPATLPGAPTGVSGTFGNSSVSLTWTAPANNGGAAISGYVVTPYKAGVAQATQTFNSAATTETVTGLTNGTAYTFTVSAINIVGTGPASAQTAPVTPATTPGAPTIGTATAGVGSATVTWTAPGNNGGAAVTGYVVTPYKAGVAQATQTFNSTATTETAIGLANNTAYTFAVAAINVAGTGAASAQSNSVTTPNTPGAPTIGTATFGNASATVTWTAPASNGGNAITGYVITPYKAGVAQATQTFNTTATTDIATGLTNGSSYTFTVAAINGVGTGAASAQSNAVTPATVPGAPTGVSGTFGNASVSLTWTAPGNNGGSAVTGYVVTPYAGGVAQPTQTFNSAATTETVTGLTNGTAYTFTVAAINIVGTGAQSTASASVTPATTPGAPTIGTATFGNASATVTWTAPGNNGGSAVTGYVITPYKAGVAQATQTFNTTATTDTAIGLTNGSSYTFTVAAINIAGTGTASGQSNAVIPATVPGAPTIGTATFGNASATVTWTAPGNNGGSAVTGYVITPYKAGVAQATQTFNTTATTDTVIGLTNGSSYTFTVAAINGVGTGTASAQSNAVTPATTPGAPTGVSGTSGNASVSLSWTAPGNNGGSAVTGYVVTPYIGVTAQATQTFNTTATTDTVTGLTNGTAYTFTVAAINIAGTGGQSTASAAVTPATTPGAPTIGTATFGNASATVTWTAPGNNGGSAVTGYVITPYKAGVAQATQTFNSTATTETATGLTNGSSYTFTVAAINGVGTGTASAQSNAVTPATTPGAPTGVSGTSGNASVSLSWTAPGNNGGSAVTGYVVTPYIGVTAQATQTFNTTATTDTVTGLTNGTAYTFTVAAINIAGTGGQSTASAAVTPATTASAPTIGTATAGVGSATVTWTAPGNNGGSAVTGYVVTPYKAGVAQATQTFNSTATTETATGLANNTAYTFAVAAINVAGTGTNSAQSNSVTTPTTPGAPTIGTATFGNASASVTWTAPASNGGNAITGYVVTPYLAGTAQATQTFNSTATTETATGLTNGSSYTFTVAAINGVGTGTASAQSNSVIPATTPGAPTGVSGTFGNASVSLSWTAPGNNGGSAVTGYVVTPYIGVTAQATQTFNTTATTDTVTGLTNGTTYTFTVAAINIAGTGGQSTASAAVTPATTASAPTIGTATAGVGSATVTWTAPGNNGGSAVTGYVVTPYKAGVAQATQTFNSTATTETATGLANNTAYTFAVAAINVAGTGTNSAQSNSVTTPTTPGAPTIGTATFGNASASVTWTAPASNGGNAITGYVVTPYLAGTAQATQTFNSTATTETATGLTNGSSYTFTVAAINGVGTGTASAQSNSVIPATTPGAPSITATMPANQSVAVTWNAPASNGGSAITGYKITPYIAGVAQAIQTFASTATTETATGLTNGTAYTFTVAAVNGVGTGTSSAASASATPATTANAPTIGTATIAGVGSATVTWTAPGNNGGSAITGYVVTPYIAGVAQTIQNFGSTATTETLIGLANNTAYTFAVAAVNGMGTGTNSAQSNSVTTPTTPGAPTIGTGTSGNASVSLSWTAPASNGGNAITGYVVTPYIAGTAQTAQTFNTTATTDTVTGLTNGTAYTFKVAAINGVGTGAQSAASAAVTPATTAGAPTGVSGTSGNASVSLSWTAPGSTGGSAITGYVVTPYIGVTAQATQTFNTTATTDTVTGLTNGTAYTFTVAAINGVGTGTSSTASAAVTPATTPGAPTGVSGTKVSNGKISVSWTAPASTGGSAITGYTVTPYKAGVAQTPTTFNTTATTDTVTGLTTGTAYTFKVAAINGVGTGTQSAASGSVTA